MKQTKYFKAIEQISVSEEKQEEVWNAVLDRTKAGNKKRRGTPRWRGAAAAVIFCVLAVSGTAFADDIQEFFKGILTRNENVKNDVEENVFSDTDGHVTMEVVELLSDEMVILATIRYEALDETGQEWLASFDPEVPFNSEDPADWNDAILQMEPDSQGNSVENGVSCSMGCEAPEEYTTEREKVFFLNIYASDPAPAAEQVILTYEMTDKLYTVTLDTSTNVPIYEYDLVSRNHEAVSEYYTPAVLRISKLSYCIYGRNHGLFEMVYDPFTGGYKTEVALEEEKYYEEMDDIPWEVEFEKEDGTWITVDASWGPGDISTAGKDQEKDMLVYSATLFRESEHFYDQEEAGVILDPAEITGLQIGDAEYDAV